MNLFPVAVFHFPPPAHPLSIPPTPGTKQFRNTAVYLFAAVVIVFLFLSVIVAFLVFISNKPRGDFAFRS